MSWAERFEEIRENSVRSRTITPFMLGGSPSATQAVYARAAVPRRA